MIGWAGVALAVVGLIGLVSMPSLGIVWVVLLVFAVAAIPQALLAGRAERRNQEADRDGKGVMARVGRSMRRRKEHGTRAFSRHPWRSSLSVSLICGAAWAVGAWLAGLAGPIALRDGLIVALLWAPIQRFWLGPLQVRRGNATSPK
jgi:membrane protein YdbS with pleckstrin-like domain